MKAPKRLAPDVAFRFDRKQPPPAKFNPSDWTIVKRERNTVAAQHTSGEVRKMPAHWLEQ